MAKLTKDQEFQLELHKINAEKDMLQMSLNAQTKTATRKQAFHTITIIAVVIGLVLAIQHVAGKTTLFSLFADIYFGCYAVSIIAIVFGAYGLYHGRANNKLTEKHIEEFAPFRKLKESMSDTNRTSSGLNKDGKTNPGDET